MTPQEIKKMHKSISKKIDKKNLRDAISEITQQAKKAAAWHVKDRIEQVEQNYRYMLKYMADGIDDPQRADVYADMVNEVYHALDMLVAHIECEEANTLYYSTIRTNRLNPRLNLLNDLHTYEQLAADFSMLALASDEKDTWPKRKMVEMAQNKLFLRLWTTPYLTSEEASAVEATLKSEVLSNYAKQHLISALTLGMLQIYDKRKLELLMTSYLHSSNIGVSSAALVGMLLSLWKYSDRPLTRRQRDILMAVKEKSTWSRDLRLAYIEMIRARDTENINRKMRDEVIPKMEKLRPNLLDKINVEDPTALQENPEWQEMLEKSGVADQLKELTEIQMEGGDVMMSTFAHLKTYTFFNDMPNWFLPFEGTHSDVWQEISNLGAMGEILSNAPFLCDSDKYSFVLTLKRVPEDQQKLMMSQFNANADSMYEAMSQQDNSDGPETRRKALNTYMQNIYRFFKLYLRKDEFFDPFSVNINLIRVPSLADDFFDAELLHTVAEFYFKLKFDEEALSVFKRLEALGIADAPMYQKMGYCYERMHDYQRAIEYYKRTELLEPNSLWTLRRLATCYRESGAKGKAQKYYKALAEADPDDLRMAMLYGQSLLENGDYDEALLQFYKVEFLDEKSNKAWRPLAWTLFMTGDLSGAEGYYKKLKNQSPTPTDLLNYGHVALAQKRIPDAISLYSEALKAKGGDIKWLIESFKSDSQYLQQAGIDLDVMPMIADAVAYSE